MSARSRCPGCDLEMDEDDLAGQRDHMEKHHPEIIAEHLAETGFRPVMAPIDGSEPLGAGFGNPWVPQPGVTFLASGAFVRSVISQSTHRRTGERIVEGQVAIDVQGRWNHGAHDKLSLLADPEIAREWGTYLLVAADAAVEDAQVWHRQSGEGA